MSGRTVVIAGGHGKIAAHLIRLLAEHADTPLALIRNAEHSDEVASWGGMPILADLEHAHVDDLAGLLDGADAAVFAAGAGPGSGVERKDTVDRGASVLLADAAERAGVRRFLQVSAFGAGEEVAEDADETWAAYVRAKTAAEADLHTREQLDWTILRPGGLTDDPATGTVRLVPPPGERGKVSRADVAAVLFALLDAPGTTGQTLVLTEGSTPIAEAVAAL